MDVRNSWSQKQQIAKVASTLIWYDSGFELKKEIDYKTYRRWEIKINEGVETSTAVWRQNIKAVSQQYRKLMTSTTESCMRFIGKPKRCT
mmetsp:Transcript_14040/g.20785  ORF Transcript_14040/g.20785 Transcript_14040/m.20785 type:complete len:90 (-) Transcript_14040:327-596(-)